MVRPRGKDLPCLNREHPGSSPAGRDDPPVHQYPESLPTRALTIRSVSLADGCRRVELEAA